MEKETTPQLSSLPLLTVALVMVLPFQFQSHPSLTVASYAVK